MKTAVVPLIALLFLASCAHGPGARKEADSLDQGWGQAQLRTWAQLVAHPEGRSTETPPEGLAGNTAEEIMGVYNKSFAEKPTKLPVFQFGVVTGK